MINLMNYIHDIKNNNNIIIIIFIVIITIIIISYVTKKETRKHNKHLHHALLNLGVPVHYKAKEGFSQNDTGLIHFKDFLEKNDNDRIIYVLTHPQKFIYYFFPDFLSNHDNSILISDFLNYLSKKNNTQGIYSFFVFIFFLVYNLSSNEDEVTLVSLLLIIIYKLADLKNGIIVDNNNNNNIYLRYNTSTVRDLSLCKETKDINLYVNKSSCYVMKINDLIDYHIKNNFNETEELIIKVINNHTNIDPKIDETDKYNQILSYYLHNILELEKLLDEINNTIGKK